MTSVFLIGTYATDVFDYAVMPLIHLLLIDRKQMIEKLGNVLGIEEDKLKNPDDCLRFDS